MVYFGGWQFLLIQNYVDFDCVIWVCFVFWCQFIGFCVFYVSIVVMEVVGEFIFYGKFFRICEVGFEFKIFNKCELNLRDWINFFQEDIEDGGVFFW